MVPGPVLGSAVRERRADGIIREGDGAQEKRGREGDDVYVCGFEGWSHRLGVW